MKLSSIPHLYRNVRRWTEILSVLSKYGLADWISRLNIDFVKDQLKDRGEGVAIARQPPECRIRLALMDLGPTFIKFGQLLSTRPDIVGVALSDELKKLCEHVSPDAASVVRETLERELGRPVDELFAHFDDEPVATASIGQVHKARLMTGELVAVKVQRYGIERMVREDLEVLTGLAQLAERIPEFAPYRPSATIGEMSRMLRRELDFGSEERNLQQFAARFEAHPVVKVPSPFTDFCTPRVLTMEWIEGWKLEDADSLRANQVDFEELAMRGANVYLEMIFEDGFFHADPHPGNLAVLPGNRIALLDFGMVGRLEENLREEMEQLLLSMVQDDVPMLTAVIKRIGHIPDDLDESALAHDLADFVGIYSNQQLEQFDLSAALNDMTEIIRRYQISLPFQAALLIKVLVTLEGTSKALSPNFSVMEVMRPFQRRMLLRRLSPRRQARKVRRLYYEMERVMETVPKRLMDIVEQVQSGRFDVHLDHRGLEPSVNRLVLGMLASALFLGSSWMLAHDVPPVLFSQPGSRFGLQNVSILGLVGCFFSMLLGLRLFRAIGKSGHLDRRG